MIRFARNALRFRRCRSPPPNVLPTRSCAGRPIGLWSHSFRVKVVALGRSDRSWLNRRRRASSVFRPALATLAPRSSASCAAYFGEPVEATVRRTRAHTPADTPDGSSRCPMTSVERSSQRQGRRLVPQMTAIGRLQCCAGAPMRSSSTTRLGAGPSKAIHTTCRCHRWMPTPQPTRRRFALVGCAPMWIAAPSSRQ